MQIYIDGEFRSRETAKVSVFDHGLLYGDGVFEGIRVYNRRIFRLDAHLDRLYDSAQALALKIPLTPAEMRGAVEETVRRNQRDDVLHPAHRHARRRRARHRPASTARSRASSSSSTTCASIRASSTPAASRS